MTLPLTFEERRDLRRAARRCTSCGHPLPLYPETQDGGAHRCLPCLFLAGVTVSGPRAGGEQHDSAQVPHARGAASANAAATIDWVWQDYLAKRTVTLLGGKPKAGKSTLAMGLAQAIAAGGEFLGRATTYGRCLRDRGVRADAPAQDPRGRAEPAPAHPRTLRRNPNGVTSSRSAVEHAHAVDAGVPRNRHAPVLGGPGAEKEKDAGAAQEAMEAAIEAAASGLAVLLVAHTRRAAGRTVTRSAAAPRSLAPLTCCSKSLERPARNRTRPGTSACSLAAGGFPQTPGALLVDHDPRTDSWRVVGEGVLDDTTRERSATARRCSTSCRPRTPRAHPTGTQERRRRPPRLTVGGASAELIDDGHVGRDGAGVKGDPFRFRKILRPNAAQPAAQHSRTNGREGNSFAAAPRSGAANELTDRTIQRTAARAESNPNGQALDVDTQEWAERLLDDHGDLAGVAS